MFSELDGTGGRFRSRTSRGIPPRDSALIYSGNAPGNAGEFYLTYDGSRFSCPIGQIAGNLFLTFDAGVECLPGPDSFIHYCGPRYLHFALAQQG